MDAQIRSPWISVPRGPVPQPAGVRRTTTRSTFPDPVRQRRAPLPSTVVHSDRISSVAPDESGSHRATWNSTVSSPTAARAVTGTPRRSNPTRTAGDRDTIRPWPVAP